MLKEKPQSVLWTNDLSTSAKFILAKVTRKSSLVLITLIISLAVIIPPIMKTIDTRAMRMDPVGTATLFFQYMNQKDYKQAAELYWNGIDPHDIASVGSKDIKIQTLSLLKKNNEYAVVEISATIEASDYNGTIAMRKNNDLWYIIRDLTENDAAQLQELFKK